MFTRPAIGTVAYNAHTFVGRFKSSRRHNHTSHHGDDIIVGDLDFNRGLSGNIRGHVSANMTELSVEGEALVEVEPAGYRLEEIRLVNWREKVSERPVVLAKARLVRPNRNEDEVGKDQLEKDEVDKDQVEKDQVDKDQEEKDEVYKTEVDRDEMDTDAVDKDVDDKNAVDNDGAAEVVEEATWEEVADTLFYSQNVSRYWGHMTGTVRGLPAQATLANATYSFRWGLAWEGREEGVVRAASKLLRGTYTTATLQAEHKSC
jgi:hypothetical protein